MSDHVVLSTRTIGDMATWLEEARTNGAVALIDKEENWTSFDCVAKLRGRTKIKKVGHAGTLDPLATGLLILCFGKATKSIESFQDAEKAYDVTIKLGATTATDDRGSDEVVVTPSVDVDTDTILAALRTFVGTIQQVPPAFAAVRHGGRRQYDLARNGEAFTPKPRVVTIHNITNVVVDLPYVTCTVQCSKGTYIRSIARDLGALLGCGGYAYALRRTRIGAYSVDDAVRVEQVGEAVNALNVVAVV